MNKKFLVVAALLGVLSLAAFIGTMTVPTANEDSTGESLANMELNNDGSSTADNRSDFSPMSLDAIKEKYDSKFASLEEEAVKEVSKLVDIAIIDIQHFLEDGEKPSIVHLYSTYYRGATELLEEIDSRFEGKYSRLTNELTANGYSPEAAEEYRNNFDNSKREYIVELVNTLMEDL